MFCLFSRGFYGLSTDQLSWRTNSDNSGIKYNLSANQICAELLFVNSFPNAKTVSNMEKTASESVSHAYSDSLCHLQLLGPPIFR